MMNKLENQKEYPEYICSPCARSANGKLPAMAWFHMDICGVCNKWTSVSSPRYYGYPDVKSYWDLENIIKELHKVKFIYQNEGNLDAANEIQERINRVNVENT